MNQVVIYTKNYCPFCARAKHLLARKGIAFEEIDVTFDPEGQQQMIERSGRRTVPQVFIDGAHIGGSDDLADAERNGELDHLADNQASAA